MVDNRQYEEKQKENKIEKNLTNEKSAQRRRKHYALAVVRRNHKFSPAADPFPGAQDGQNLISWRWSLPLPINPTHNMIIISCDARY